LDSQLLRKELLDALIPGQLTSDQLKTRLQILIYEKRFQQLKEEVANVKSNDFIIEAAEQIASIYPKEIIEKAEKEICNSLGEAVAELEDGFDVSADAFAYWKNVGFRMPPQNKDAINTPIEYPDDHYLTFVRKSFVLDEADMGSYTTFLEYVATTEDIDQQQFAQPFETFREMRQKDRACARHMNNILGWVRCGHTAFTYLPDRSQSLEALLKRIEHRVIETLNANGQQHLLIVCCEVACVANWNNVLQKDFFDIVNLFKAISQRKMYEFITHRVSS